MNPENIIEIVQSVMPAVVSCMGVVVSCLGVIKQFKQFKNTTAGDVNQLKNQVQIVLNENAQLKKTCRELTEVVTKIKRDENEGKNNTIKTI